MNRIFEWEGVKIPFPTEISWEYNEISDESSGRTLSGKMNKKTVATKRKINCSWKLLNDSQASILLKTVKVKTFGKLKFPDPFDGDDITRTFYTGDATAKAVCVSNNNYTWDISMDFIEQ